MDKLNNKGMTLIEVLVSFTLLMIITISLYSLITRVRLDLLEKEKSDDLITYSDTLNTKIHTDLIKIKPFAIIYKNSESDSFICKNKEICTIQNDVLTINYNGKKASTDLTKICYKTYPCALISYIKDDNIVFKELILNINNKEIGYGIRYDGIFEPIPNSKDVVFNTKEERVLIEVDNNNFFVINFPLYLVGDNNNYGFRIAYPLIEQ